MDFVVQEPGQVAVGTIDFDAAVRALGTWNCVFRAAVMLGEDLQLFVRAGIL